MRMMTQQYATMNQKMNVAMQNELGQIIAG